jgi:cation diffusion facilitator CzcD-associated flavoprotein CzcO
LVAHVLAAILAYMRGVADKYGVPQRIRYNTEVTEARWDDPSGLWHVTASDGTVFRGRFLFNGAGGLERPKFPAIEGIERFGGTTFHSARWNSSYDLRGKRVAVIGNAASGVQLIPHVQRDAATLTVFMRSANWVLPKPDRAYLPLERALLRALPFMPRLYRGALFLRQEALHKFFHLNSRLARLAEKIAIGNITKSISDPDLVAALTPDYPIGCKRILMSNDFFPALAQPNVKVVRERVARATPTGLVDGAGVEREFDAIIYATGFDVFNAGIKVYGLGGADMEQQWLDGPEAYKTVNISEIPNMFYLLGPNSALGHNSVWLMIEAQVKYALKAIKEVRARGDKYIVVRRDAMVSYNRTLQQRFRGMVWSAHCQGWYKTKDGRVFTLWPGNVVSFRKEMKTFDLRHYDFVKW